MVLLLSVYKTEKIWLSFIYLLSILDASWRKFGFFVDFLKFVLYCDGRVVTFWPSSCRWRQNYLSLKKICYFHFEQKKTKWAESLIFFFFFLVTNLSLSDAFCASFLANSHFNVLGMNTKWYTQLLSWFVNGAWVSPKTFWSVSLTSSIAFVFLAEGL